MFKKWNVIGFFEDTGKIVSFGVEADSSLAAFALAARESDAVTLVAAIPGDVEAEFPGESVVHAETVIEQDDVFQLPAKDAVDQQGAKHQCPNCGELVDGHPENGCILAALVSCLEDRGEHDEHELAEIHANANVDALWADLGPIVDKLGDGGYSL